MPSYPSQHTVSPSRCWSPTGLTVVKTRSPLPSLKTWSRSLPIPLVMWFSAMDWSPAVSVVMGRALDAEAKGWMCEAYVEDSRDGMVLALSDSTRMKNEYQKKLWRDINRSSRWEAGRLIETFRKRGRYRLQSPIHLPAHSPHTRQAAHAKTSALGCPRSSQRCCSASDKADKVWRRVPLSRGVAYLLAQAGVVN